MMNECIQENEDIELICRVEDGKPKPDIIWYIGGVEITKGEKTFFRFMNKKCPALPVESKKSNYFSYLWVS